jgi:carbon-monoxide dehydrogenase medium subunit
MLTRDEEGRCRDIRLALCGVGETPVDASGAASALAGQPCSDPAIGAVAAAVQDAITPSGNVHASADYQRHIAGVLVGRAIKLADQRAGHAS